MYRIDNAQQGEKYNTIFSRTTPAQRRKRNARSRFRARFLLGLYLFLMILPIYWLINMSLQTNSEILGSMTLWPQNLTFDNYIGIFTNSSWYMGYVNSMLYVALNMLITICVALPAAYAFSRYRFIGDKHLFFWLLTNLMAPPAVFLLPYFQLYYSVGLFDTHIAVALAHCLFNIPLAIWILEGFMSSVPKEIDETAYIDGYSFPRFFIKIFIPMIRSGIGVTLFFLFMFSWVELLLARTLTATDAQPIGMIMTRTSTASGIDWGTLAAAGGADHRAGHFWWCTSFATISPRALPWAAPKEHRYVLDGMDDTDCHFLFIHCSDASRDDAVGDLIPPPSNARGFYPLAPPAATGCSSACSPPRLFTWGVIGFTTLSIWIALALSAVWLLVLMRWG